MRSVKERFPHTKRSALKSDLEDVEDEYRKTSKGKKKKLSKEEKKKLKEEGASAEALFG